MKKGRKCVRKKTVRGGKTRCAQFAGAKRRKRRK